MTSEATARYDRQRKIHHAASVIYHICLVVYIACQFARGLYGARDMGDLPTITVTLQQIVRFALLGLCLEHCCFSPREGFIRLAVLGLAYLASGTSNILNNIFDFAAFLFLSDLSKGKKTLRLVIPVFLLMGVVMAWMTVEGRYYCDNISHAFVGVINSLGMSSVNSAAALFASFLMVLWQLFVPKNKKLLTCLFFWVGALIMYRFTVSMTVCLLVAVFPFIDIVVSAIGKSKKSRILKLSLVIPMLFAALSIGLMLWLGSAVSQAQLESWSLTVRNFLTRFTNAAIYMRANGISLLGTPVDRYVTDNLFLNILLCHGILGLVLMLGLQTWMLNRLLKSKRYDLLAIQIMMLGYAMMETVPMAVLYNITIVCLPSLPVSQGETAGAPEEAEQPYHDISKNGFGRNLAIFMCAVALVFSTFYWTVAEDWDRTAVGTDSVNRTTLLPQMDGTSEIRQTMTVVPDQLQNIVLGITVISDTQAADAAAGTAIEEVDESAEITEATGTVIDPENSLHICLEHEGQIVSEWDISSLDPTASDLIISPTEALTGLTGKQVTLVITGRQPVCFWYGNTISAGKFDIKANSTETLTWNGTQLDGQLVLRQSGVRILNQSKFFWPVAGAVMLGLLALLLIAHQRRTQGKPFFLNTLADMKNKYRYLLHMLVSRDFHVKYRSSVLGMVWSFLNPMLMTLIYMFVFSTIFQNSIENFTVYVMTGIVLFNYFSDATNLCMQSIVGNGGLITKVYIPKYIFPVSKALSAAINLCISMIPLLLIMAITGVPFQKSLLLLPLVLIFLITFSIGVGLILSAGLVFFRDVQFLWGIMITILNFLSPVFYPESIIPAQFIRLYHLNPLYQFLYFMRTITLGGVSPQPITYLYCGFFSLASLILGIIIFRKNQDRFVLYL